MYSKRKRFQEETEMCFVASCSRGVSVAFKDSFDCWNHTILFIFERSVQPRSQRLLTLSQWSCTGNCDVLEANQQNSPSRDSLSTENLGIVTLAVQRWVWGSFCFWVFFFVLEGSLFGFFCDPVFVGILFALGVCAWVVLVFFNDMQDHQSYSKIYDEQQLLWYDYRANARLPDCVLVEPTKGQVPKAIA